MKQVKLLLINSKAFIFHHKTLSLVILGIIILDISLLGVIADIQQKQFSSISPSLFNKSLSK